MNVFIKIVTDSGFDIGRYVESFVFEESAVKADMLKLTIKDTREADLDSRINTGENLTFSFGYLNGKRSNEKKIRITNVKYRYTGTIDLEVLCLSKAAVMRKTKSHQVWSGTTRSIAQDIASRNGLTLDMEGNGKSWASIPQGHRNDFEFLQYLINRDNNGDYIMYVSGDMLIINNRGIFNPSQRTFWYRGESSQILEFSPSYKETATDPRSLDSMVMAIDPLTNDPVVATSNSKTAKNRVTTDVWNHVFTAEGDGVGVQKEGGGEVWNSIQSISERFLGVGDAEETENKANSEKKSSEYRTVEGVLVIVGDPYLLPNRIITIKGVLPKHEGNYLASTITHEINDQGYRTKLNIAKNASPVDTSGKSEQSEDVNNTEGSAKANKTVPLRLFDAEGNLIQ